MRIPKKIREEVYNKFNGRCAYTGKELDEKWQVDHITPKVKYIWKGNVENMNDINNLFPTISIVNHYKRGEDLEMFRRYMSKFHLRLAKLPKKTSLERTKRRIEYMNTIAQLFDITIDTPFSGKFYFENLN